MHLKRQTEILKIYTTPNLSNIMNSVDVVVIKLNWSHNISDLRNVLQSDLFEIDNAKIIF